MTPRLPFLLVGLSALGACAALNAEAPKGPAVATSADRHRITVEQTAERMEIQPEGPVLSTKARNDLRSFASGYLRYGHGAMVLSAPAGAANETTASALASDVRLALLDAGVSYAALAPSTYDASGRADAPIVVSFARYEARAPECAPLWEQDLAHQMNNQPWESFGCAQQANLAAMVEDPADLLRPRDADPRDGERRSVVFEHYRQGEQTHAERSDDEQVTVSNQ